MGLRLEWDCALEFLPGAAFYQEKGADRLARDQKSFSPSVHNSVIPDSYAPSNLLRSHLCSNLMQIASVQSVLPQLSAFTAEDSPCVRYLSEFPGVRRVLVFSIPRFGSAPGVAAA